MVKRVGIYIAPGRKPWPKELRVAEALALDERYVEFLEESNTIRRAILGWTE